MSLLDKTAANQRCKLGEKLKTKKSSACFEFDDVGDSAHLSDKVNLFQDLTSSLQQIMRQKQQNKNKYKQLFMQVHLQKKIEK